ncbi:MAG: hypothetical protein WCD79_23685 [Chthoniobacteraceae bacterium]
MRFRSRIAAMIAVTVVVALSIIGYFYNDAINHDFTPWMSVSELGTFVQSFDAVHSSAPTYWEKHWITAAEGRWHDGIAQYRIRYSLIPAMEKWSWRWFVNEDQASFDAKLQAFGTEGFVLVYHYKFKGPDGVTRYQGVWHKLLK